MEVIAANQVVIVAGETGSGKSTQLPKFCLALGLGESGRIGHTQPRRIAARSIAERVAEELGTSVGELVGYSVRFNDEVGPNTKIKLMTDGILLAEIQRDRKLSKYSVLIIDEAHERSLNVDFLLGYLKQLLPRRPDLKVIVTSATIDTARFSEHFDGAPIIEVSGRSFPVEIGYRPLDDRTLPEAIVDAASELWRSTTGDVLVFCSGERDIRDAAEALGRADLPGAEVFPLYARLSSNEQQRVFRAHRDRRIVLATNVAETSLTVPGIRSVVDPGLARISRYSARTKVQRLPIEEISQASADQRAGRCGRVAPGVCLRLYEEDDFLQRDEFTEPEIRRTNLASVILQMAALDLGDIEAFPFVEAPDLRNIRDGIALLEELDAVDPEYQSTKRWLTPDGKQLARLPVDPRLGRMVIEANRLRCLHEVMVIAAGLSVQDPRERPSDKREAAAESHARFDHPTSDFLSYLELWEYLETQRRERSGNQFRRMCRNEFLNFNRIREWQDIYRQLRRVAQQLGFDHRHEPADTDDVHQALLAGLLSQFGQKLPAPKRVKGRANRPTYAGPRNMRFTLAPGSKAAKAAPEWVMAAELVETNQLRARTITRIDSRWLERMAEHLVDRTYTAAIWNAERGAASATERVLLYGMPIVAGRPMTLARVNPELAREFLIQNALVVPEWSEHQSPSIQQFRRHEFLVHNESLVDELRKLESRSRQRDLVVDDAVIFAFYDKRIPAQVTSVKHFNSWWKKAIQSEPHLLDLTRDHLLRVGDAIDISAFPDHWSLGELDLDLHYEFDSSSPVDGLTVDVPVEYLAMLHPEPFTWNVPGLRRELIAAHIRSLPKDQRRAFIPVPETARSVADELLPSDESLAATLRTHLGRLGGFVLADDALADDNVPAHLRPTFRVIGVDGVMLAAGKDLRRLKARLDARARQTLAATKHHLERSGLRDWPDLPDGRLPDRIERVEDGHRVWAYPALIDDVSSVSIALLPTRVEQAEAMWHGVARLLEFKCSIQRRAIVGQLGNRGALALAAGPYPSVDAWVADVAGAILDEIIRTAGGPPRDVLRFKALEKWAGRTMPELVPRVAEKAVAIVKKGQVVRSELSEAVNPATAASIADAQLHLERLDHEGSIREAGAARLDDLLRYLSALEKRLERMVQDPGRDAAAMHRCRVLEQEFAQARIRAGSMEQVAEVANMLEEFRVSVFAQSMGTNGPVSEKRIRRALAALA